MLTLHIDGLKVELEIGKFPAGETALRIVDTGWSHTNRRVTQAMISCDFASNDDIVNLLLLTDAVRRRYQVGGRMPGVALTIPYLPYARQDRVCAEGEPLSIRVISNLINAQRYQAVFVSDVHSDVSLALINNVVHVGAEAYVAELFGLAQVVISPDAGAAKRARAVAAAIGNAPVVAAEKIRDPATGRIIATAVHCGNLGSADVLIVDDICDGGATFIQLAQQLRTKTTGRILLYITHGIFSAGLDRFDGLIDHIYVAHAMAPFSTHPKLTHLTKATA